jgi:hypothetical protein
MTNLDLTKLTIEQLEAFQTDLSGSISNLIAANMDISTHRELFEKVIREKQSRATTDWTLERVATSKEKAYAQETEKAMIGAGYSGLYAGGARSKGNGFWVSRDGQSLGYMNCRSIRKMLKNQI